MTVRKIKGMALIAVVFIMVIMSGAVLMMSRFSDIQAAERSMDLMGARALSAAQSGLGWATYMISSAGGVCPTSPTTLTMHTESDLAGMLVTITCDSNSYTEGINTVTIFNVQASATFSSFDSTGEYVFRRLSAVVELES